MKKRSEILARIDQLAMEERAQLDRLEKEGKPELLETDPTEKDQYDKRAADIEAAEKELESLDRFESRQKTAREREERLKRTPVTVPVQTQTQSGDAWRGDFRHFIRTGETRGLMTGDDKKGGNLAPKEFVAEIIKDETEICPFRALARVRGTSRLAVQMPRRTAQFSAVWAGEATARTETDGLRFGLHEVQTMEMVAVVDCSNWMMEDADFDMEAMIREEVAEQFAVAETTAFIVGNGNAKPWGVTVDTAVTDTTSGSNGDFDADDLIDLLYGLKGVYQQNATWLFNRTTLRKIRKLKANNEYIWAPADMYPNNITRGLSATILGRPYQIAPEMQNTGTTGNISVIVGDFRRGYLILDHVSMRILRDDYTQAGSGNVRFWARRRVGGQIIQGEAIRRLKEST